MKKQELLHLHRLLADVARHIYARESDEYTADQYGSVELDEAVEGLGIDDYADIDVVPPNSKTEHREAVLTLAGGLSSYGDAEDRTVLMADGGEEKPDLEELGEDLLEGHEETLEQEEDPIESREMYGDGERKEEEDIEKNNAGYEGFT